MQIRSSGWTAAQNMLSTEELLLVPTSFHQTLPHCHYRYLQLPHIINIISHGLYTYHHHLSLNHDGHLGTTDDFTTSFFHYFFSVLHCPLGLGELQACPVPDVVFPPLPLSRADKEFSVVPSVVTKKSCHAGCCCYVWAC